MENKQIISLTVLGLALMLSAPARAADAPAADSSASAPATAPPAADNPTPAADSGGPQAVPADNSTAPAAAETGPATAEGTPAGSGDSSSSPGWFYTTTHNIDTSFGGFIRPEAALKTSRQENSNNQRGNPFNTVSEHRVPYLPPGSLGTVLGNQLGLSVGPVGTWSTLPLTTLANNSTRPVAPSDNVFNLHILRAEGELGIRFGEDLKLIARVRTIGELGHYSDFDAGTLNGFYGGISGGNPALYGGAPNYFQYQVEGDKHPNPLEWAGPNYMVYFPALVLDFNHGPLNVRIGNQAIAWGQAIFFRVLDVVDGLDLRRHSVLDYAQEEYSDKRVPSLGVRVGYQITDDILADGFFQKFQPTIYGNPNTQYNVIPVQFTVHDNYKEGGYENKFSYGLRLKGSFGQWGFQAIAVRRWNPDGVFRWTASGVNKPLPQTYNGVTNNLLGNTNLLGTAVNDSQSPLGASGPQLAQTAFEASPGGVYSADEWFHYAAQVRLDGISGLNASINDFEPATGKVFASPVQNYQQAWDELQTFFVASGGLRGHIQRDYFQEYNFGGGVSYVVEGEPGSILDQLIINLETTYTPDRVYTATTLGKNFLHSNDWVSALVLEKYQRFSQAFPATYFVFQYMHRTRDDLFGRSLKGYGGVNPGDPNVAGFSGNPNAISVLHPQTNANYIVFAFQQPFPQDIYRVGFALLADPHGGILVQPGLQWKPSGHWAVDGFYTYINDRLGGNPNSNLLGGLDWANEFTVRIGYQF